MLPVRVWARKKAVVNCRRNNKNQLHRMWQCDNCNLRMNCISIARVFSLYFTAKCATQKHIITSFVLRNAFHQFYRLNFDSIAAASSLNSIWKLKIVLFLWPREKSHAEQFADDCAEGEVIIMAAAIILSFVRGIAGGRGWIFFSDIFVWLCKWQRLFGLKFIMSHVWSLKCDHSHIVQIRMNEKTRLEKENHSKFIESINGI